MVEKINLQQTKIRLPDTTIINYIKKTWQEYTEELYKKDLHDTDNHDGVITHIEPEKKKKF